MKFPDPLSKLNPYKTLEQLAFENGYPFSARAEGPALSKFGYPVGTEFTFFGKVNIIGGMIPEEVLAPGRIAVRADFPRWVLIPLKVRPK